MVSTNLCTFVGDLLVFPCFGHLRESEQRHSYFRAFLSQQFKSSLNQVISAARCRDLPQQDTEVAYWIGFTIDALYVVSLGH